MRVLLHTLGTSGDEAPMLALGEALKARGHEAVMLMNETAQERVASRGLGFRPVWKPWSLDDVLSDPAQVAYYTHPTKSGKRIIEDIYGPLAEAAYEATRDEIAERGVDVVVSHLMCMGSSWAARDADRPYMHVTLAPVMWGTLGDRAAMFENPHPPWWPKLWWWIGQGVLRVLCRPYDQARRRLGLSNKDNVYNDHIHEAAVQLGMWAPALRPRHDNDPAEAAICGFALGDPAASLRPELSAFLEGGEPPVVIGLGSAVRTAANEIYRQTIAACAELGRRLVVVGAPAEIVADRISDDVFALDYAPYSALFPHAAAIVHAAGAGTNGEAMRAGKPTVTIPFANDQYDNSLRVEALGASLRIPRSKLTFERLRDALERALTDPTLAARAGELGDVVATQSNGPEEAATLIERLAATSDARR